MAAATGSGSDSNHITKQQLQSKRNSTSGSGDSSSNSTGKHGEMSQIEYAVLAAEHNAELQKAARKSSRVSLYYH
jgi:hypothetical protein